MSCDVAVDPHTPSTAAIAAVFEKFILLPRNDIFVFIASIIAKKQSPDKNLSGLCSFRYGNQDLVVLLFLLLRCDAVFDASLFEVFVVTPTTGAFCGTFAFIIDGESPQTYGIVDEPCMRSRSSQSEPLAARHTS